MQTTTLLLSLCLLIFWICSNHSRARFILVDSQYFNTWPGYGGVEALIQLSIAFAEAVSNRTERVFIGGSNDSFNVKYLETYTEMYGSKLVRNSKLLSELGPGDLYIIPESVNCPQTAPNGTIVVVYLLSNAFVCRPMNTTTQSITLRYISHNNHLTQIFNLSREEIIHPYVSERIVRHAVNKAGLIYDGSILQRHTKLGHRKQNLILIDNDVPNHIRKIFQHVCAKLGGRSLLLNRLTYSQISSAYEEAKAVVDWDMRGSERCPLESSLFGALLITNGRETGGHFVDFPIPSEFVIPPTADHQLLHTILATTIRKIFTEYWSLVPLYAPLRRTILGHTAKTMANDCSQFLDTLPLL